MSKKQNPGLVIIAHPAELETAVTQTRMEIVKPVPQIGRIGKSKLVDAETMRRLREEVKILASDIDTHYRDLGAVLADDENLGWEPRHIVEEENQLVEAVLTTSAGKPRDVVTLASAQAMLMHFPQTMVGLNHFADHGLAIGFFKRWSPGALKYFVELPVGPNYAWTRLISEIPSAMAVLAPLTSISQSVGSAMKEEKQQRVAWLRGQAASLLEVITSGQGETVCHVVLRDEGGAYDQYVHIQVTDGWITALDAMGTPQTEELIGVAIPIDSLDKSEPYRFEHRALKGMTPKQVRMMYDLRRFVQKATARAERVRQHKASAGEK